MYIYKPNVLTMPRISDLNRTLFYSYFLINIPGISEKKKCLVYYVSTPSSPIRG